MERESLVLRGLVALALGLGAASVPPTFSAPAAAAAAQGLTLASDGQATSTIVLAQHPTRTAQFAAHELQWHLRQITDAEIPVVREPETGPGVRILVGGSEATAAHGLDNAGFASQEYVVRFLPDTLVVMGRDKEDRGEVVYSPTPSPEALRTWPDIWDEQGTMYAVYEFLERCCNVRWLNPTEKGTDIPRTRTLTVSGPDVRRTPFFRYRFAAYPASETYDAYTALWPRDTDGFRKWEKAAFPELHRRFPDPWRYTHAKRGWIQLFRYRMREGGEKCVGNHSLYGYYKRFWEKDPKQPEAFREKHADWFAQGYEGRPPQMCYTSPGLIAQVAQDARDYFDGHGINPWTLKPMTDANEAWGRNYFCVEPMDNDRFCTCASCRQWLADEQWQHSPFFSNGRHSDYFFHFVNEVARLVRKTHPDKWIVTLAYMSHAAPPQRVKLEPNIAVQFCFACNRLTYDRASYEHEISLLKAWREQEKGRPLYLWLYYTFPVEIANGRKFHCFPGFFAHAVGEQFSLFETCSIRGMFHCGYGQDVEAYVTYKLMANPGLSVDDLLEEYFDRLYGAAAGPMKQLYLTMEEIYGTPANYSDPIATGRQEAHHHQTEEMAWGYLGTARRMASLGRLMSQAKQLASTELERQRVALFEMGVWDYMTAGREQYMERVKAQHSAVGAPLRVPLHSGAPLGGDPSGISRDQAAVLWQWCSRLGERTRRKVEARLLHDATCLVVQFEEMTDPRTLVAAGDVLSGDYWNLVIAKQRGRPYRELAIGPKGVIGREHGTDRDAGPTAWNAGATIGRNITRQDRWLVSVALPLAELLPGGVEPGERLFVNLARRRQGSDDEPVWIPTFGDFHDPTRLREVVLDAEDTIPAQVLPEEDMARLRTEGLVGWWPLIGEAGTTVRDASGNELHGALVNGAGWSEGTQGTALRLDDGRRQYVDFGDPDALSLTGPLTLTAWVRYETSQTWYPAILGKGYEQTGAYSLHLRPGLTLWFEVDAEDGTRHFYNPTDLSLTPAAWAHIAATYDGATMRVYVNGRQAGKGKEVTASLRRTAAPFRIGWLGSYGHLNGCVRDAAVYCRAMSWQEVHTRYRSGPWQGR